jgi:FkbM family methyltransferase
MEIYKFKEYELCYPNIGTLQVQLDTVFNLQIYKPLHITKSNPYIIDCGANIGVSVFYFKHLFPLSEILAFEPEPAIFNLLVRNIETNYLANITTINSALSNTGESKTLLSDENDSSKLLFNDNFTIQTENDYVNKIVKCTKLSKYLDRPIDFLKMNIEGAEIYVLKEIGREICNINEAVIEYHYFSYQEQELHVLLDLLHKNDFIYSIRHVFRGYDQYLNPFPKKEDSLNPDTRYCILIYACRKC